MSLCRSHKSSDHFRCALITGLRNLCETARSVISDTDTARKPARIDPPEGLALALRHGFVKIVNHKNDFLRFDNKMTKIIAISVDDLAQWAGPSSDYASQVSTPNIDRLLDTGVNFTNAYTTEAICNAARTATFSGMMTHNTGVHANTQEWTDHITAEQTWPAFFLENGFDTGGFGKILHGGFISGAFTNKMFTEYAPNIGYKAGKPANKLAQPLPDGLDEDDMADTITVDFAIDFIENYGSSDFMLTIGLYKPHLSWVVPQEYFDLYPIEDIVVPGWNGDQDDLSGIPEFILDQLPSRGVAPETIEQAKEFMQGYLASVSYMDAQLGRLLDALEDEDLFDDTNIVLFSDHGFHLGDMDNTWGKFTLWEEAARVPLVIKTAGNENAGTVVDDVVNLVDIFPTLVDMAGLTPPDHLDGTSLMPLVMGEDGAEGPGFSVTWMYGSVLYRDADYAYILYEDGSEELYDMINDPAQTVNLALDPAYATALADQRLALYEAVPFEHVEGAATGDGSNDTFVLSDASDIAAGGEGNDIYFVNDSDATIIEHSGEGKDTVFTSVSYAMAAQIEELHVKLHVSGPLTIIGNGMDNYITLDGYDQIAYGGDGDDVIYSTCTNSEIYGQNGHDEIRGGYNSDILHGGDGNDKIFAGGGADQLIGGNGDDLLHGGMGDSSLSGGNGNDTLLGGAGDEFLIGGSGSDLINGGGGTDMAAYWTAGSAVHVDLAHIGLIGGAASGDVLISIENLHGSAFDDNLSGDVGANVIYGGKGGDNIEGRGGADQLFGGHGDDTINGGLGNDLLQGGDGQDDLHGGRSADTIYGNTGDDTLDGQLGRDLIFGGAGNDLVIGGAGIDALYGDEGDDTLDGGSSSDSLYGGSGRDEIYGGTGLDVLSGGSDDDYLSGGGGSDLISGDDGNDIMEGGTGLDVFVYSSGHDQILDFANNTDTLSLDSTLWGGAALTSQEILGYASTVGSDVVFDFGNGNTLTLVAFGDPNDLLNDIQIF